MYCNSYLFANNVILKVKRHCLFMFKTCYLGHCDTVTYIVIKVAKVAKTAKHLEKIKTKS